METGFSQLTAPCAGVERRRTLLCPLAAVMLRLLLPLAGLAELLRAAVSPLGSSHSGRLACPLGLPRLGGEVNGPSGGCP